MTGGAWGSLATRPLTPLYRRPLPPFRVGAEKTPASLGFVSIAALKKKRILSRVSCFVNDDNKEGSSADGRFERVHKQNASERGPNSFKDFIGWRNEFVTRIEKAVVRFFLIDVEPWLVPWTAETILKVMLLWIFSFWLVGSWIIPFLAHAAGFSKETLTHRGQALYSLLTDLAEGLTGIMILRICLVQFRPLPPGWFQFRLKGRWHMDVCLGCLMFPLVNLLSQVNLNLVPVLPTIPVGVSGVEQSVLARDPIAIALYVMVVSVCAPIWEEIMFRGFLIPSLTRYMPLWSSILVSSVAFALAHFNARRLLPLVFLGVVMGAVFARSRNLLACMLLHSLWNGFVFLGLLK